MTNPTPPEQAPTDDASPEEVPTAPADPAPEDPIRRDGWIAPLIATVGVAILSYAVLAISFYVAMGSGSDGDAHESWSWGAGAARNVLWGAICAIPYVTPLGLVVAWALPWRSRWTTARRQAVAFALLPHVVIVADLLPLLAFGS
ncbi:hypothetical protein ACIO87_23045 [Streptomyces sp. NPDC087218]|uniref:hypothetical protein n=1 Tax=Streptomyces sp. NPDC087218 TaxID=3365769 RepID=UPI00381EED85